LLEIIWGREGVKEIGANGLVDLIAFMKLEIINELQMELHMSRARDGRGSERGGRKQSYACLWSKGAVRREGHETMNFLSFSTSSHSHRKIGHHFSERLPVQCLIYGGRRKKNFPKPFLI